MVVRNALVAASQIGAMKSAASATPLTKSVARRFVAGEAAVDAVQTAADLAGGTVPGRVVIPAGRRSAASSPATMDNRADARPGMMRL